MTPDDILRMAREADPFGDHGRLVSLAMLTPGTLERFAALVAAREREECAAAVEQTKEWKVKGGSSILSHETIQSIAAAIRARGKT